MATLAQQLKLILADLGVLKQIVITDDEAVLNNIAALANVSNFKKIDEIASSIDDLDKAVAEIASSINDLNTAVADLTAFCIRIGEEVGIPGPATGVEIQPGEPTPINQQEGAPMPTQIILVKQSTLKKAPVKFGAHQGDVANFVLVDNETNTFTLMGADSVGNPVDISNVATLTPAPSVSDPTTLAITAVTGMSVTLAPVGNPPKLTTPGTPNVLSMTATWNDGSLGPFTATLPIDVVAGTATGVTGVVIVPGVPTVTPQPAPTA